MPTYKTELFFFLALVVLFRSLCFFRSFHGTNDCIIR